MTDIHRARELARDLVRELDLARAPASQRALVSDLADARQLARDLARDLAPDAVRGRLRNPDRARELASTLARARELARASGVIRDLDRALARALARAESIARELARARAESIARELDRPFAGVRGAGQPPGPLRVPMPLAGRLTAIAAQFLPGAERARYREEFGSELAEIALAGGGRRAQLAYSARTMLSSAWQLRAALRSPARRGALQ